MASDFMEYTFTLPDGSKCFEMVEKASAVAQIAAFMRMHGAKSALPSAIEQEIARREKPRKARREQTFDCTALPLFGDGHRQRELF